MQRQQGNIIRGIIVEAKWEPDENENAIRPAGDVVRMHVQAVAVNCNVRIDRAHLEIEDTYLDMSRSKVVTIQNNSDYIVEFEWKQNLSSDADDELREKFGYSTRDESIDFS